jgi:predicted DNA-binding transcriptional regulator YafY
MSIPATRVLGLLEQLQNGGWVDGVELAQRLEVDRRTVRRYVARLQELGIPVEGTRGRYGGYRLRPGYRLPPLMLSDDEATAVVLGLIASRQMGLAVAEPWVEGTLAKILRVLPQTLRERVRALEETLGFTDGARQPTPPATAAALAFADAIRAHTRVHMRYEDHQGRQIGRDVDPYGLVFHGGRWYLAARDHASGEIRTFRVDRAHGVTPISAAEPAPEGFDAVGFVARSLAQVPWRWEVEVLLETTLDEALARIPPTLADLEATPYGILLHARAERLDGMAIMLASLGRRFTIRHPPELRDAVRDLAARLTVLADR